MPRKCGSQRPPPHPDKLTFVPRTLTRIRKISFSLILAVGVLVVLEVMAQLTYRALYDHSYRPKKLPQLTSSNWLTGTYTTDVPSHLDQLVVHPYFGFSVAATGQRKKGLGFREQTSPSESRQHAEKLRVLVLGGSVAVQLMHRQSAGGKSFLENALRDALDRQEVKLDLWIFNGALQGFKQPQQFLAYSYILTQGGEFDLVLNLDGFNEMVLAVLEGKLKGLHPAHPRGWDVMVGRRLTAGRLREIGQLLQVRENQAALIEFANSTPLARSAIVGLFVAHRVMVNDVRAQELVGVIEHEVQQGELRFEEGGVPFDFDDEEQTYRYLAELWARSSRLLSQLARGNSAEYLHVFQPNQYLEGSKPLSKTERERYYIPNAGFGPVYRAAYPYFQPLMKGLRESGWFVDASMVFREEERTVYSDICCHLNELGRGLLAAFIAEEVAARSDALRAIKNSKIRG